MSHALIFGASGISGWAILNEITTYPTPETFAKITGLSNRPLTLEQAYLPQDPRLNLVNGVDLTKSVSEVVQMLKEKVQDAHTISHVFFTAYIQTDNFESLKKVNTALLDTALRAIEQVSPVLKKVILQTGGKGYGLEFPDKLTISTPLREDMPRIPEPYASRIFYYSQHDLLVELSKGKDWTFTEVRPDGIIGFTPINNAMNLAQGIGLYLTIYREVHGRGAKVNWPGTEKSWKCKHSDTAQGILAKFEIYAATYTKECSNGSVFNIADGKTVTWEQVWPKLCADFGLEGVEPASDIVPMETFVKKNIDTWKRLAGEHGLERNTVEEQNWPFVHFMLVQFDFDRQYDLTQSREIGFEEEIETAEGYIKAWEKMRTAKILPPRVT
ncbi:sirq protein [Stagonosporopsis vannaccii]|nr:sirq protein [Stagonosporopsis vannaccii]